MYIRDERDADERVLDYAQRVVDGRIVAGPHVRNTCQRHIDDLDSGHERGLYFSNAAAQHIFDFFELGLKLSDGQFDGVPLLLAPVQAFLIGSLFGWYQAPMHPETGEYVFDPDEREELGIKPNRRFRRAYIEMGKGNGKAISNITAIPTPYGWSTMGDIHPGDYVFGADGKPVLVIAESETWVDRPTYEVEFDCGEVIVADENHLWLTTKEKKAIGAGRSKKHCGKHGQNKSWKTGVRTTKEIFETLRYPNGPYRTANHKVALSAPLDLPDADLLVPPYTLGAWLGDGDTNGSRITYHDLDREVVDAIGNDGYEIGAEYKKKNTEVCRANPEGLYGDLKSIGVSGEKHIPSEYLRASYDQRLALMQGLMDTDGHIAKGGQCEYTSCVHELGRDVLELALSLGLKATMQVSDAKLYGRITSKRYRVFFFPGELPVFRLKRKLERIGVSHSRARLSGERRIVDVRPVASVPVKCIQVANPDGLFLCGRSFIVTHNSPMVGGVGLYGMMADDEPGAQIYAAAANKEQAAIMFKDAVKMVRQAGEDIRDEIEMSGGFGREFNMVHHASGSFFRPMSKEAGRTGSGLRPHFALCDEVHEHPDRKVMEMLERGFKARENPLLLMITNSGSDRNSICWEEHEIAIAAACGCTVEQIDKQNWTRIGENTFEDVFSYVCALDNDDDPLTDDSCWIKANPMMGVILKHSYLEGVAKQAREQPGKRNGILRLHFCQWTDSDKAWMSRTQIDDAMEEFDPYKEHAESEVSLGVDLSAARDMTVVAHAVKTGMKKFTRADGTEAELPTFDAWIEAWTPGDTLKLRASKDKQPYEMWVEKGHLKAPDGKRIRYDHVAAHVARVADLMKIKGIAYDRYAYSKFQEECDAIGLEVDHIPHPQGGKNRAKPYDKWVEMAKNAKPPLPVPLGLWMPGSVKAVEDAFMDGRLRLVFNPVLMTALMGATLERDAQDNGWFVKALATVRIDAAVALAMAIGLAEYAEPQVKKKGISLFFL